MRRSRLIGLSATVVLLTVLAVAAVLLAPLQVGGRTAYVITSGSSMEPTFHAGDLVLTRGRDTYAVGDIVLYRSAELDRDVLHRVVARDGARYVMQGDNNGYRDPERPTADSIRGEAWLLVPGAGRPLQWVRNPAVLSVLTFLVVFGLLAGGREVSRRRAGPAATERLAVDPGPPPAQLLPPRALLTGATAALCVFGLLAVLAFGRSPSRTEEIPDARRHAGTFSYEAAVPRSAVYPGGRLVTGDTVFTSLVRKLRLAFDYRLTARDPSDVRGGIRLDAVVSDGLGWTRTLPISPEQPFSDGAAHVEGTLDVAAVHAIVDRVKALTGTTATLFTVRVTPTVQLAGYAGTALVDETYRPSLDLSLDAFSLRPTPGADGSAPTFRVEQADAGTEQVPRVLGLGVATVSVERARSIALLGLGVSLLAAVAAAVLLSRQAGSGEAGRIRARHGARLVDAHVDVPETRWLTDVGSVDELARIAERFDRVILRDTRQGRDLYYVDDGLALYRYRSRDVAVEPRSVLPSRGR